MSDKKITCSRIKWIYNYQVKSIIDNYIELNSGEEFNELYCKILPSFQEKEITVHSNELIYQELMAYINKDQIANLEQFRRCELILILSKNDKSAYIWGNQTIPVQVLIDKDDDELTIKFYRETTELAEFGDITVA